MYLLDCVCGLLRKYKFTLSFKAATLCSIKNASQNVARDISKISRVGNLIMNE